MKRIPFLLLLIVTVASLFVIGCRDEEDPQYNIDLLYDRPWREKALKNIQDIFSKTMQENGNDLPRRLRPGVGTVQARPVAG